MKDMKRYWNAIEVEEYIISVSVHNKEALAVAMSHLDAVRDFKDPKNQKAFSLLESRFANGENVDEVIAINEWTDLGIYENAHEARRIATCANGDFEYQPKIQQLRRAGGVRKAQMDLQDLYKLTQQDTTPEKLAQVAMKMANTWIAGTTKKYLSAEEVEEKELLEHTGEKLKSGIPILDDVLYKLAGQRKGTVKATILREKHGKTRHACWEVAQDLRQGYKVLYVTLEGSSVDIKDNVKEVLQDEWAKLKQNLFIKDGTVDADEIQTAILEAVFVEKIDKVVIDYLQLMQQPDSRNLSENENTNRCCQQITQLAVRYNFNLHYLAQARQPDRTNRGYSNVPRVHDVYGSNQLIKDASIILVGFRPKLLEELVETTPMGTHIKAPPGADIQTGPINSVFIKPVLSRKKINCLHRWLHFIDSDEGFKLHRQEMV